MVQAMFAVAVGSAVGGLVRWVLSQRLSAIPFAIPLGTLVSNIVAGYVVGLAIAWISQSPGLSPQWRLLIVTGFCGGLSTFSSFSAEVVAMLERGDLGWAASTIAVHVCSSIAMTFLGLWTWRLLHPV